MVTICTSCLNINYTALGSLSVFVFRVLVTKKIKHKHDISADHSDTKHEAEHQMGHGRLLPHSFSSSFIRDEPFDNAVS